MRQDTFTQLRNFLEIERFCIGRQTAIGMIMLDGCMEVVLNKKLRSKKFHANR